MMVINGERTSNAVRGDRVTAWSGHPKWAILVDGFGRRIWLAFPLSSALVRFTGCIFALAS